MLSIDLQEGLDGYATNFTCQLLRLICKADKGNFEKLRKGFPVEAKAIEIYRTDCPYTEGAGMRSVDWGKLAKRAKEEVDNAII